MTTLPTSSSVWDDAALEKPHDVVDKRERVRKMFGGIARTYDLINRLHSFGIDQRWRKRATKLADLKAGDHVLDVACGTGDLTFALARRLREIEKSSTEKGEVIGVDYTPEMLPLAREKSKRLGFEDVKFEQGDACFLDFERDSFDVISIAFGIRNVENVERALSEFHRVLRSGGRLIILEFSEPKNWLIRKLNHFYSHVVMPMTATWISGDQTGAYKYLPKSVKTFKSREEMISLIQQAGFDDVSIDVMTFGVCVGYRAIKR